MWCGSPTGFKRGVHVNIGGDEQGDAGQSQEFFHENRSENGSAHHGTNMLKNTHIADFERRNSHNEHNN